MPRNDITGVLDVEMPLPERFEQVSAYPSRMHYGSKRQTVGQAYSAEHAENVKAVCRDHAEQQSSPESYPGLVRGDMGREFFAVELFAEGAPGTVRAYQPPSFLSSMTMPG